MEYGRWFKAVLEKNNSEYTKVEWAPYSWAGCKNPKTATYYDIIWMLNNDILVVFSYYTMDKEDGLKLYYELGNYQDYGTVTSHYMTIIGVYIDIDKAKGIQKTMLKVVSWGTVYYIDYDEYAKKLNYMSNILHVGR